MSLIICGSMSNDDTTIQNQCSFLFYNQKPNLSFILYNSFVYCYHFVIIIITLFSDWFRCQNSYTSVVCVHSTNCVLAEFICFFTLDHGATCLTLTIQCSVSFPSIKGSPMTNYSSKLEKCNALKLHTTVMSIAVA